MFTQITKNTKKKRCKKENKKSKIQNKAFFQFILHGEYFFFSNTETTPIQNKEITMEQQKDKDKNKTNEIKSR